MFLQFRGGNIVLRRHFAFAAVEWESDNGTFMDRAPLKIYVKIWTVSLADTPNMEPGSSAAGASHQAAKKPHPRRGLVKMKSRELRAQRKRAVQLHLEQLARDLCLTGERMSVWSLLPIDLLVRIVGLLPLPDRGRCALVCKRWNTVCHMPDLWHDFVFKFARGTAMASNWTPKSLIKQVFERHKADLKHVTLKVDSHKQSVETACDVLTRLGDCTLQALELRSLAKPSFTSAEPEKVVGALGRIFSNSPLKLLGVEETPIDDGLLQILADKSQATLSVLRIDSCPLLSAPGIASALGRCIHLCELSMDYSQLSDVLLQALCTSPHKAMKDLNINVVEPDGEGIAKPISWQSVSSIGWNLLERYSPNLAFSLQFHTLREDSYAHFFHSRATVTTLHFACLVSEPVLCRVARHCPRLRELLVANSGDEPIDTAIVEVGERCRELRALELSGCLVGCGAVVQLAKLCGPRLATLVLHEEMLLETEGCNMERMTREVSNYLQRPWDVVFLPTWFE